ncbi:MAG TPA: hypothetical protein VM657_14660 [Sphingomonas sp.]|nr:hypothetical protein [Sphingomonas sp.]
MATIITLLGLWALLMVGRGTPIGRALERGLVEAPAGLFGKITRGHVLLALTLVGMIGAVFLILDYEGLRLISMAAPEISSFVVMVDASAWLDVAAAAIMAASTLRVRALAANVRARIAARVGGRARRRAPRSRPAKPTPKRPSNDDDPAPALLAA